MMIIRMMRLLLYGGVVKVLLMSSPWAYDSVAAAADAAGLGEA